MWDSPASVVQIDRVYLLVITALTSIQTMVIATAAMSARMGSTMSFPAIELSAASQDTSCHRAKVTTGSTRNAGIASTMARRVLFLSHSRTLPLGEIQNSRLRIE